MQKIPYVFVWTPKYENFAAFLSECIREYSTLFEERPLFISQETWDSHANKIPGGNFMCGCSIKLQVVYELLHQLPENSYFIFSDADILLFPQKPIQELLELYIKLEADIVFMREHLELQFSNVGFSLIRVNDVNRDLFKRAIQKFETEPDGLDGTFINECLKNYKGTHFWFPPELVATTSTVIQLDANRGMHMRHKLCVFQALCDGDKPSAQQIKQKFEQYRALGFNTNGI